jgi:hypothetical protein
MLRVVYGGLLSMLGEKYGFNNEEALEWIGSELFVEKKKEKKVEKKQEIPLPFMNVNESKCKGCKMNRGLYTQCENEAIDVCSGCMKEASKNNDVLPYGRIEERAAAGSDFKDSKGRSVTPYMVVLEKLKITKDEACAYASSIGIELPDSVFEMPAKKEKEVRGRPKKAGKGVQVDNSEDLFAGLLQSSLNELPVDECSDSDIAAKKEAEKLAKEAEKLAKEAEKLAKKEALEAEKEAKKQALEAEKEAKKQALEAEKEAKKQAQEKEKADKLAKKEAQEAEKLAKKAAQEKEKADKLAKKEAKKAKTGKKEEVKAVVCDTEDEEEEEEEEVSCTKFEFNGKKYLKSTKNVLYDIESQDEIGVWNDKEQKIEYSELSEDEEEE